MPLALFDVDGTLTTEHTWKALMVGFAHHGLKRATHRGFLAVHYPLYMLHKLGLVSQERFRRVWAGDLAWYFRGLTPAALAPVLHTAVDYLAQHWRAAGVARLQQHLDQGDPVVLVSAAPEPLLRAVGQALGVAHVVGTRPEMRQGRYTGRTVPPVCIGRHKAARARAYAEAQGWPVDWSTAYAYADAISDLDLLEMVGHPVAVAPDPALAAIARERGWEVVTDPA
ncbi:MAG: HAD-IB family hydrolase [Chloroflexi bacterium]|nr:HAD-IB family hydrolase [Chloroflexota bacterium]